MNNIKSTFSIKDLENLTGIKAHTIRVWEKRYNMLEPQRTKTNIRLYDLTSFQKLLNVSYLNNNGYKISKIASLESDEILKLVRSIATKTNLDSHAINAFKLAMLNFDQVLFYRTYDVLLKSKSFKSIFKTIFIPLLNDIGFLWQTNTITPAHEHFISSLVRQKLVSNTEKAQLEINAKSKETFVLFLPENEIHELGLMYLHYELIMYGYNSIYLGQSVPLNSLADVLNYFDNLVFLSYFTVRPNKNDIFKYLKDINKKILTPSNSQFWVLGQQLANLQLNDVPQNISKFKSIEHFIKNLKNYN